MADILDFGSYAPFPDLDGMDREELLACLETVRAQIEQWDEQEPKNMNSEE